MRQLRNVIRRAAVVSDGPALTLDDVSEVAHLDEALSQDPAGEEVIRDVFEQAVAAGEPLADARDRWNAALERAYLTRTLERAGGDPEQAAKIAGIHKKSFARLLRKHGIEPS